MIIGDRNGDDNGRQQATVMAPTVRDGSNGRGSSGGNSSNGRDGSDGGDGGGSDRENTGDKGFCILWYIL